MRFSNKLVKQAITVGHDVRKAVADGFPLQNVIATDLHAGRILI
jgi:hypothetical protein